MSKEVATANKSNIDAGTLIPAATLDDIMKLDRILSESRQIIRTAQPMTRAFATAAAMRELEKAITPAMFADIKNLMDSPLGFKTDRKPGTKKKYQKDGKWVEEEVKPYHDTTIKRCVIVALLAGAELAGNQFNIIASQTYFTKEFMEKYVHSWPGLTHFQTSIGGPMKHGEKTAIVEASARWCVNGEEFELECLKTDKGDMRIVVNCHSSSGPDQLRGLAESKLLRRVVSRLTGLNLDIDVENQSDNQTIEGKVASPVRIEHGDEPQSESGTEPQDVGQKVTSDDEESPDHDFPSISCESVGNEAADAMLAATIEEMMASTSVVNVSKVAASRIKELETVDWSDELHTEVFASIMRLKLDRVDQIKSTRGPRSNKR